MNTNPLVVGMPELYSEEHFINDFAIYDELEPRVSFKLNINIKIRKLFLHSDFNTHNILINFQ